MVSSLLNFTWTTLVGGAGVWTTVRTGGCYAAGERREGSWHWGLHHPAWGDWGNLLHHQGEWHMLPSPTPGSVALAICPTVKFSGTCCLHQHQGLWHLPSVPLSGSVAYDTFTDTWLCGTCHLCHCQGQWHVLPSPPPGSVARPICATIRVSGTCCYAIYE